MRTLTIAAAVAFLSTSAFANDVFGVWKSAVNDEGGYIHVEIGPCASDGAKVCGIIKDAFNVDPAKADPKRRAELKAAGDYAALQRLPRDASPTRLRNLCALTGRSRGVYRKFKVSRIMLRRLALEGKAPGLRKASW